MLERVEILSLDGKIVKTISPVQAETTFKINLLLPPGIYIVKAYNRLHTSVMKLIVL
jgi:hypothetical protein